MLFTVCCLHLQVDTITEASDDVAGLLAPCSSPPSPPNGYSSLEPQQQQQQQQQLEHQAQDMQQQTTNDAVQHDAAHQQKLEQPDRVMGEQVRQHSHQQPAEQQQLGLPVTPMHVGVQQQASAESPVVTPLRQPKQQDEAFFAEVQSESSYATGAADSLPVSPTSSLTPPSSSKAKTRSQARREKAAAKPAAKAAKAAAAEQERQAAGLSSPGSSMMSLLQRIKRTMPSIKHRPGSGSGSSCTGGKAVSTASPVKDSPCDSSTSCNGYNHSSSATSRRLSAGQLFEETLGSWGREAPQQQQQQQQQVQRQSSAYDSAAGGVSLDDVCLDMGQEHAQEQGAAVLLVPGQDPSQQHNTAPQQQPAQAAVSADAAAASSPAADAGQAAGRRSTAAQLAATMEQFRQSAQQMQQLWVQLQSLSLNSDEAGKLQQMLTPHKAETTTAAAASGADGIASTGQSSSSSSQQPAAAEPVELVKQMVQEEVLQTIYGLHAAVTGMPSSATGPLLGESMQLCIVVIFSKYASLHANSAVSGQLHALLLAQRLPASHSE
jgi:hypothetical protein